MSKLWRSNFNPKLLLNLNNADYFEIQGVKELDEYKVAAYYSGVAKIIFQGSHIECDLFLTQIKRATSLDARRRRAIRTAPPITEYEPSKG